MLWRRTEAEAKLNLAAAMGAALGAAIGLERARPHCSGPIDEASLVSDLAVCEFLTKAGVVFADPRDVDIRAAATGSANVAERQVPVGRAVADQLLLLDAWETIDSHSTARLRTALLRRLLCDHPDTAQGYFAWLLRARWAILACSFSDHLVGESCELTSRGGDARGDWMGASQSSQALMLPFGAAERVIRRAAVPPAVKFGFEASADLNFSHLRLLAQLDVDGAVELISTLVLNFRDASIASMWSNGDGTIAGVLNRTFMTKFKLVMAELSSSEHPKLAREAITASVIATVQQGTIADVFATVRLLQQHSSSCFVLPKLGTQLTALVDAHRTETPMACLPPTPALSMRWEVCALGRHGTAAAAESQVLQSPLFQDGELTAPFTRSGLPMPNSVDAKAPADDPGVPGVRFDVPHFVGVKEPFAVRVRVAGDFDIRSSDTIVLRRIVHSIGDTVSSVSATTRSSSSSSSSDDRLRCRVTPDMLGSGFLWPVDNAPCEPGAYELHYVRAGRVVDSSHKLVVARRVCHAVAFAQQNILVANEVGIHSFAAGDGGKPAGELLASRRLVALSGSKVETKLAVFGNSSHVLCLLLPGTTHVAARSRGLHPGFTLHVLATHNLSDVGIVKSGVLYDTLCKLVARAEARGVAASQMFTMFGDGRRVLLACSAMDGSCLSIDLFDCYMCKAGTEGGTLDDGGAPCSAAAFHSRHVRRISPSSLPWAGWRGAPTLSSSCCLTNPTLDTAWPTCSHTSVVYERVVDVIDASAESVVKSDGRLVCWTVATRTAGICKFRVWRPLRDGRYQLVGEHVATVGPGVTTVPVRDGRLARVASGDVIGLASIAEEQQLEVAGDHLHEVESGSHGSLGDDTVRHHAAPGCLVADAPAASIGAVASFRGAPGSPRLCFGAAVLPDRCAAVSTPERLDWKFPADAISRGHFYANGDCIGWVAPVGVDQSSHQTVMFSSKDGLVIQSRSVVTGLDGSAVTTGLDGSELWCVASHTRSVTRITPHPRGVSWRHPLQDNNNSPWLADEDDAAVSTWLSAPAGLSNVAARGILLRHCAGTSLAVDETGEHARTSAGGTQEKHVRMGAFFRLWVREVRGAVRRHQGGAGGRGCRWDTYECNRTALAYWDGDWADGAVGQPGAAALAGGHAGTGVDADEHLTEGVSGTITPPRDMSARSSATSCASHLMGHWATCIVLSVFDDDSCDVSVLPNGPTFRGVSTDELVPMRPGSSPLSLCRCAVSSAETLSVHVCLSNEAEAAASGEPMQPFVPGCSTATFADLLSVLVVETDHATNGAGAVEVESLRCVAYALQILHAAVQRLVVGSTDDCVADLDVTVPVELSDRGLGSAAARDAAVAAFCDRSGAEQRRDARFVGFNRHTESAPSPGSQSHSALGVDAGLRGRRLRHPDTMGDVEEPRCAGTTTCSVPLFGAIKYLLLRLSTLGTAGWRRSVDGGASLGGNGLPRRVRSLAVAVLSSGFELFFRSAASRVDVLYSSLFGCDEACTPPVPDPRPAEPPAAGCLRARTSPGRGAADGTPSSTDDGMRDEEFCAAVAKYFVGSTAARRALFLEDLCGTASVWDVDSCAARTEDRFACRCKFARIDDLLRRLVDCAGGEASAACVATMTATGQSNGQASEAARGGRSVKDSLLLKLQREMLHCVVQKRDPHMCRRLIRHARHVLTMTTRLFSQLASVAGVTMGSKRSESRGAAHSSERASGRGAQDDANGLAAGVQLACASTAGLVVHSLATALSAVVSHAEIDVPVSDVQKLATPLVDCIIAVHTVSRAAACELRKHDVRSRRVVKVIESAHPLTSGWQERERRIRIPGASSISVVFDRRCETAGPTDWIAVGNDPSRMSLFWGRYGKGRCGFPAEPIELMGDTLIFRRGAPVGSSPDRVDALPSTVWGFRVVVSATVVCVRPSLTQVEDLLLTLCAVGSSFVGRMLVSQPVAAHESERRQLLRYVCRVASGEAASVLLDVHSTVKANRLSSRKRLKKSSPRTSGAASADSDAESSGGHARGSASRGQAAGGPASDSEDDIGTRSDVLGTPQRVKRMPPGLTDSVFVPPLQPTPVRRPQTDAEFPLEESRVVDALDLGSPASHASQEHGAGSSGGDVAPSLDAVGASARVDAPSPGAHSGHHVGDASTYCGNAAVGAHTVRSQRGFRHSGSAGGSYGRPSPASGSPGQAAGSADDVNRWLAFPLFCSGIAVSSSAVDRAVLQHDDEVWYESFIRGRCGVFSVDEGEGVDVTGRSALDGSVGSWAEHMQCRARIRPDQRFYANVAWTCCSAGRAERAVAAALIRHSGLTRCARSVSAAFFEVCRGAMSLTSSGRPTAGENCDDQTPVECAVPDIDTRILVPEPIMECFVAARKIRRWLQTTRAALSSDSSVYPHLSRGIERRARALFDILPIRAEAPEPARAVSAESEATISWDCATIPSALNCGGPKEGVAAAHTADDSMSQLLSAAHVGRQILVWVTSHRVDPRVILRELHERLSRARQHEAALRLCTSLLGATDSPAAHNLTLAPLLAERVVQERLRATDPSGIAHDAFAGVPVAVRRRVVRCYEQVAQSCLHSLRTVSEEGARGALFQMPSFRALVAVLALAPAREVPADVQSIHIRGNTPLPCPPSDESGYVQCIGLRVQFLRHLVAMTEELAADPVLWSKDVTVPDGRDQRYIDTSVHAADDKEGRQNITDEVRVSASSNIASVHRILDHKNLRSAWESSVSLTENSSSPRAHIDLLIPEDARDHFHGLDIFAANFVSYSPKTIVVSASSEATGTRWTRIRRIRLPINNSWVSVLTREQLCSTGTGSEMNVARLRIGIVNNHSSGINCKVCAVRIWKSRPRPRSALSAAGAEAHVLFAAIHATAMSIVPSMSLVCAGTRGKSRPERESDSCVARGVGQVLAILVDCAQRALRALGKESQLRPSERVPRRWLLLAALRVMSTLLTCGAATSAVARDSWISTLLAVTREPSCGTHVSVQALRMLRNILLSHPPGDSAIHSVQQLGRTAVASKHRSSEIVPPAAGSVSPAFSDTVASDDTVAALLDIVASTYWSGYSLSKTENTCLGSNDARVSRDESVAAESVSLLRRLAVSDSRWRAVIEDHCTTAVIRLGPLLEGAHDGRGAQLAMAELLRTQPCATLRCLRGAVAALTVAGSHVPPVRNGALAHVRGLPADGTSAGDTLEASSATFLIVDSAIRESDDDAADLHGSPSCETTTSASERARDGGPGHATVVRAFLDHAKNGLVDLCALPLQELPVDSLSVLEDVGPVVDLLRFDDVEGILGFVVSAAGLLPPAFGLFKPHTTALRSTTASGSHATFFPPVVSLSLAWQEVILHGTRFLAALCELERAGCHSQVFNAQCLMSSTLDAAVQSVPAAVERALQSAAGAPNDCELSRHPEVNLRLHGIASSLLKTQVGALCADSIALGEPVALWVHGKPSLPRTSAEATPSMASAVGGGAHVDVIALALNAYRTAYPSNPIYQGQEATDSLATWRECLDPLGVGFVKRADIRATDGVGIELFDAVWASLRLTKVSEADGGSGSSNTALAAPTAVAVFARDASESLREATGAAADHHRKSGRRTAGDTLQVRETTREIYHDRGDADDSLVSATVGFPMDDIDSPPPGSFASIVAGHTAEIMDGTRAAESMSRIKDTAARVVVADGADEEKKGVEDEYCGAEDSATGSACGLGTERVLVPGAGNSCDEHVIDIYQFLHFVGNSEDPPLCMPRSHRRPPTLTVGRPEESVELPIAVICDGGADHDRPVSGSLLTLEDVVAGEPDLAQELCETVLLIDSSCTQTHGRDDTSSRTDFQRHEVVDRSSSALEGSESAVDCGHSYAEDSKEVTCERESKDEPAADQEVREGECKANSCDHLLQTILGAAAAGVKAVIVSSTPCASASDTESSRRCRTSDISEVLVSSGIRMPVLSMAAPDARALRKLTFDVNKWARSLRPGSQLDARLPITGNWAPARVVMVAPAPFSHWFRVAFDGLDLTWWRWVAWEGGPQQIRWGQDEIAPRGWQTCDAEPLSSADAAAIFSSWRARLKLGDRVNCMDVHHKWYEASVIAADAETLTVRFLGWSPRSQPDKYDERIRRDSSRVCPFGTKIRDWRRVQRNDEVEIRLDRNVDNTVVAEVDKGRRRVRVVDSTLWHDLDDVFALACFGTHKRSREWAAIDRENPAAPPCIPSLPNFVIPVVFREASKLRGLHRGGRAATEQLVAEGLDPETATAASNRSDGDVIAAAYELWDSDSAVRREGDAPSSLWSPPAVLDVPPAATGIVNIPGDKLSAESRTDVTLPSNATSLTVSFWLRLSCDVPPTGAALLCHGPLEEFVHPLPTGTLVEGRYSAGSSPWYPGRIDGINADGTYNVAYEDGDRSPMLPRNRVRPRRGTKQELTIRLTAKGNVQAHVEWADMSSQSRVAASSSVLNSELGWVHIAVAMGHGLLCVFVNGVLEDSVEAETHCRSDVVTVGAVGGLPGVDASVARMAIFMSFLSADDVLNEMCSTGRHQSLGRSELASHSVRTGVPSHGPSMIGGRESWPPSSSQGRVDGASSAQELPVAERGLDATAMNALLTRYPQARELLGAGPAMPISTYLRAMRIASGDVARARRWLLGDGSDEAGGAERRSGPVASSARRPAAGSATVTHASAAVGPGARSAEAEASTAAVHDSGTDDIYVMPGSAWPHARRSRSVATAVPRSRAAAMPTAESSGAGAEIEAALPRLRTYALRQCGLRKVLQRAKHVSSAACAIAGVCISGREHADLSTVLGRGSTVYVDLYMRRVPAVIRREIKTHRLYKVRVLCGRVSGDLGGVRALVEVNNIYIPCRQRRSATCGDAGLAPAPTTSNSHWGAQCGLEFVPVLQFTQQASPPAITRSSGPQGAESGRALQRRAGVAVAAASLAHARHAACLFVQRVAVRSHAVTASLQRSILSSQRLLPLLRLAAVSTDGADASHCGGSMVPADYSMAVRDASYDLEGGAGAVSSTGPRRAAVEWASRVARNLVAREISAQDDLKDSTATVVGNSFCAVLLREALGHLCLAARMDASLDALAPALSCGCAEGAAAAAGGNPVAELPRPNLDLSVVLLEVLTDAAIGADDAIERLPGSVLRRRLVCSLFSRRVLALLFSVIASPAAAGPVVVRLVDVATTLLRHSHYFTSEDIPDLRPLCEVELTLSCTRQNRCYNDRTAQVGSRALPITLLEIGYQCVHTEAPFVRSVYELLAAATLAATEFRARSESSALDRELLDASLLPGHSDTTQDLAELCVFLDAVEGRRLLRAAELPRFASCLTEVSANVCYVATVTHPRGSDDHERARSHGASGSASGAVLGVLSDANPELSGWNDLVVSGRALGPAAARSLGASDSSRSSRRLSPPMEARQGHRSAVAGTSDYGGGSHSEVPLFVPRDGLARLGALAADSLSSGGGVASESASPRYGVQYPHGVRCSISNRCVSTEGIVLPFDGSHGAGQSLLLAAMPQGAHSDSSGTGCAHRVVIDGTRFPMSIVVSPTARIIVRVCDLGEGFDRLRAKVVVFKGKDALSWDRGALCIRHRDPDAVERSLVSFRVNVQQRGDSETAWRASAVASGTCIDVAAPIRGATQVELIATGEVDGGAPSGIYAVWLDPVLIRDNPSDCPEREATAPSIQQVGAGWGAAADAAIVSEVAAVAESRSLRCDQVSPQLLDPDALSQRCATLAHVSLGDLHGRAALIRCYNLIVEPLLPLLDLSGNDHVEAVPTNVSRSQLGARVARVRSLLFPDVKRRMWLKSLRLTGSIGSRGTGATSALDFLLQDAENEANVTEVVLNRWGGPASRVGKGSIFSQMHEQLSHSVASSVLASARRPWRVRFAGEGGQDVGGLFAEALTICVEELMSGTQKLFMKTPNSISGSGPDQDLMMPTPILPKRFIPLVVRSGKAMPTQGGIQPALASMFEFLGKLMGVALRSGFCLPFRLPRFVWRKLAGIASSVADLRCIDAAFVSDMENVLLEAGKAPPDPAEQSAGLISPSATARQRFNHAATTPSTAESPGGDSIPASPDSESPRYFVLPLLCGETVELMPGGLRQVVTPATAEEFVQRAVSARLAEFDAALDAVIAGLRKVVPIETLRVFSWRELELEVCGRQTLDVDLLRQNTRYEGYSETDPVVVMFWAALRRMSAKQQSAVLRFVWARERLPLSAADFPCAFIIAHLPSDDPDSNLPRAHTCSFQLDLPRYSSEEYLHRQLLLAAENCVGYDLDGGARGVAGTAE